MNSGSGLLYMYDRSPVATIENCITYNTSNTSLRAGYGSASIRNNYFDSAGEDTFHTIGNMVSGGGNVSSDNTFLAFLPQHERGINPICNFADEAM